MGVERIYVCPNHFILYGGDTFKDLNKYTNRYKNNTSYCGDNN